MFRDSSYLTVPSVQTFEANPFEGYHEHQPDRRKDIARINLKCPKVYTEKKIALH